MWAGSVGDLPTQMLRYLVVGGIAFAVDLGTMVGLTELAGMHYRVAAAIAFTAGLLVNYLVAVSWVFNKRKLENRPIEFGVYALVGLVGLGLNDAILYGLSDLLHLHYTLSKLVSAAIVLQWNFFARRSLLFSRKRPED